MLNAYGMWLASPSAHGTGIVLAVDCSGNVNNYGYNGNIGGFRPLVSLKSDVQLQKNADGSYTIKQEQGKIYF